MNAIFSGFSGAFSPEKEKKKKHSS